MLCNIFRVTLTLNSCLSHPRITCSYELQFETHKGFFFINLSTRLVTQEFDCKIGLLNVKIKRSPNVNKTFTQRLDIYFVTIVKKFRNSKI